MKVGVSASASLLLQVLRTMDARLRSSVWKLCAGDPSDSCLLFAFSSAAAERLVVAHRIRVHFLCINLKAEFALRNLKLEVLGHLESVDHPTNAHPGLLCIFEVASFDHPLTAP